MNTEKNVFSYLKLVNHLPTNGIENQKMNWATALKIDWLMLGAFIWDRRIARPNIAKKNKVTVNPKISVINLTNIKNIKSKIQKIYKVKWI